MALRVSSAEMDARYEALVEAIASKSLPIQPTNREWFKAGAYFAMQKTAADHEALGNMEARKDEAYLERNRLVALLSTLFPAGRARTAIEGWSEDWHGCVYIDLPTGQASWHYHDSQAHLFDHLPEYQGKWDGHTTEQKYERIAALVRV